MPLDDTFVFYECFSKVCYSVWLALLGRGVTIQWTGTLDWNTGLEHWTGTLDWNTGLEHWTGTLDWNTGLEHWTGLKHWTGLLD